MERFHEAQVRHPIFIETEPGVRCEQILRPIAAVGLYVPAGSAPLPSAVIMLSVPARIAGCSQRVLCTPPRPDGSAHPAILVAAQLCGIDTVFKVGGAQAIAALAYGTESIPQVDKIFGPGNAWVTAAKALVSADAAGAACDLPAGPSEVLVLADSTARAEFVAADLLAQAEHDPLAQAILVTDSRSLAQRGAAARSSRSVYSCHAPPYWMSHSSPAAAFWRRIWTPRSRISNDYAPEHLILQVREPRRWLAHVRNAGSVFLGAGRRRPLGDYCSGTNHVLPTYGHARALSGLTVADFMKSISVQELSPEGLKALGPDRHHAGSPGGPGCPRAGGQPAPRGARARRPTQPLHAAAGHGMSWVKTLARPDIVSPEGLRARRLGAGGLSGCTPTSCPGAQPRMSRWPA